jgi:type I restriction enzyme S subunit
MTDWITTTVGDCIVQVPFPAKVPRQQFLQNGAFPIISQEADFINGYWDKETDVLQVDEPVVVFGDHTQVLKYVDFDFVVGADGVKVLKPVPEIDPKFFYYQLMAKELPTLGYARHFRLLRDQEIAYPDDIGEQQRIVKKLDAAFGALREAEGHVERNRANARELFESYLNGVFEGNDWPLKRLGDLADQISTGPFGTMLHKADYVPSGIPLVNPMNIVDSRIVPSDRMMVNKETRQRLSTYMLREGDVVIARRGELGRCAVVTSKEDGWLCGTGSFFMRLSAALDPNYFVLLFGSHLFKERLEKLSVGATMSSLNITILEDLTLPLPSIDEQRQLLDRIRELKLRLQELDATYQEKLQELEGLKKGLLGAAFRGEL